MQYPSQSSPLSLGFIGGSLNSAVGYTHFVSSALDKKWVLEAGCFSLDEKRNRETAQAYLVPRDRMYPSWRNLLEEENDRLDAIAVLTPTPSHHEIVSACLEAGIPVICEKALATNIEEVEKIIEVRNRKKGFLAVTYNYSGYPMLRELRNMIQKGALGRVLHFQAEMPQEGYIRVNMQGERPQPQTWRLSDGRIPTIHLDLAVHLHQLIYYLIRQSPVEVISDQDSYGWFFEVTDNVSCLCRYSNGVKGQMWFSKSALGNRNGLRIRIYGTEASAEWYQMCPEELTLSHADGRRETIDRESHVEVSSKRIYQRFKAGHPAGFIEAFANLYRDIAECLQQYQAEGAWQSEEVFGPDLAAEGLRLFEAMMRSVDEKTWRPIPNTQAAKGRAPGD